MRDKPATPWPSRLLGFLLVFCGGAFMGDFVFRIATYEPSVTAASLPALVTLVAGTLAGAVLVGVGVATILHSSGHLDFVPAADWEL